MRVRVGPNKPVFNKPLKHDDVVVVPDFFCDEDDWDIYYKLIEEMTGVQRCVTPTCTQQESNCASPHVLS